MRKKDVDVIMSRDKSRDVCATRYMIYTYLHNECKISSNTIGKYFNRSRRSILRGIHILNCWMQYHIKIKDEYNHLVEQLTGM